MASTINASASSTGLVTTADGSGIVKLQSNGVTTNSLGWINYNGSSPGVRSSYNFSSVTKAGTGRYTYNFTNNTTDANYCPTFATQSRAGQNDNYNYIFNDIPSSSIAITTPTTSSFTTICNTYDPAYACLAVFGN